jgi:hypothetical protein
VYNAEKTNPTFATGKVFLVGHSHKKSEHHMAVEGVSTEGKRLRQDSRFKRFVFMTNGCLLK